MTVPPSLPPAPKFVRCPGCDERLGVRDQDVGRKARCAKCALVFVIEDVATEPATADLRQAEGAKPQAAPRPQLEDAGPQTVTFACSLCDTRITMRVSHVGKKVACPDCGRKNVIPPPPKAKIVKAPAALSGEQFGLWGVDDKTWEGAAAPPTLHPVVCGLCQTLMYATDAQIGSSLRCPDCGTTTVAKRSTAKPAKGPRIVPAGEEYQIDAASAPVPRPVPVPIAIAEAAKHDASRALMTDAGGKLVKSPDVRRRTRPVRPAVPLVTGVWPMLLTQEVIARWIMTSILFGAAAAFVFNALVPAMSSVTQGIIGIMSIVIGAGLTVLWLTFAGPTFLAIVSESADGNDRIEDPPGWSPMDWMGEAVQLGMALGAAGLVGAAISWGLAAACAAAGVALPRGAAAVIGALGPLVVFPLALLGTLFENSALGVVSPRVLSTLLKCPGPWLLFFGESAALVAGAAGASFGLALTGPVGLFAVPLIVMGAAIVYMRLAGRLAWWISEATAVEEDEEFVDDSAAAHPHLAAERRAAWEAAREGEVAADAK